MELKFELKLKEVPVKIVCVDGLERTYTIRELSGAQRDTFLNEMGSRMKFNDKGKMAGLKDYTDLQTGFLALCLYDEKDALVPKTALREYPSSVLGELFKVAQELSGLDKGVEDENASKNDS